jgi:spore coat polysaccharide biosynthesis protein SpsF (cytidylyltransferase family)
LILIQARSSSVRLPNKSMALVANWPIIDWVIQACLSVKQGHTIVLCIPNGPQEENLELFVRKKFAKVHIYRGSELNVYKRFQSAYLDFTEEFEGENQKNGVIRVCADRPLMSVFFLEKLIHEENNQLELKFNHKFAENNGPTGIGAESLSRRLANEFFSGSLSDLSNTEHVTSNFYDSIPTICKFASPFSHNSLKKPVSLSIDTLEELNMINTIVKSLNLAPGGNITYNNLADIEDLLEKN